MIIAVGNDRQFAKLASLCGHPEWATDERFANNGARVANRAEIVAAGGGVHRAGRPPTSGSSNWKPRESPPVRSTRSAKHLPMSRHSIAQMVRTIAGMPLVGSPVRIDGDRADSDLPPPALGEHTNEVLAEIVPDALEIDRLRSTGVIG